MERDARKTGHILRVPAPDVPKRMYAPASAESALAARPDAPLACAGQADLDRAAPPSGAPGTCPTSRSSGGRFPGVAGRRFDLIVLSEILYHFGDHDLEQVLKNAVSALLRTMADQRDSRAQPNAA